MSIPVEEVKKMETLVTDVNQQRIEDAVRVILESIGEDPSREGLLDTPKRVAKMYKEICSGLHSDPTNHLEVVFHEDSHEEMVMVKDISFYSMCEHHLVPFMGKVHICYIPKSGNVVGLSKLARVVEGYAQRPQVQERLTTQVVNAVHEKLNAKGAFVVIEAEHLCMAMRGIKKPGAITVTSSARGVFEKEYHLQERALAFINRSHNK